MANLADKGSAPYAENLRKILNQLTDVELSEDIDEPGNAAVGLIREALKMEHKRLFAQAQQVGQMGQNPMMGPATPPGMGGGYQPNNVMAGPPMPNPDELRRTMSMMAGA